MARPGWKPRGEGPLRVANCSGFFGDRLAAPRELLGQTFVALTRDDASYQVHVVDAVTGEDDAFSAASPVDAYAHALLALLEQADAAG